MSIFNAAVGSLLAWLLAPLNALPPLAGLALVALVTAVVMLLCFRATSNQARLADVKRQMQACIFEARLFQDDLPAVFRALGEMLRRNAAYLGLSLVPLLWAAIPLALFLNQLDLQFGYSAPVGAPLLLSARVADAAPADAGASATLDAPDGVRVLTTAVWIPATRELLWRVEPQRSGEYTLTLRVGGASFDKTLLASDTIGRRSPSRPSAGFVRQMMYPAEPPLPADSVLREIQLGYEPRQIDVFGWQMTWIVPYFILSLVWGLVLKRPLRVTI